MTGDQEERTQQKMGRLRSPPSWSGLPTTTTLHSQRERKQEGPEGPQGQERRGQGLELESMELEWCQLEGGGRGDKDALAL